MTMMLSREAFAAAETYMHLHARLIDRLRFAHRFKGAPAAPVLHALRAYQGTDGGYGNAIEPDLRGSAGQPQGVEAAFWILDQINAFDDPSVVAACDWLAASTTEDGGVPWVLADVRNAPHAPWWQPEGDPPPAALNPTAPIAGLLHAHGVGHRWLAPATEFCWRQIDRLDRIGAYDAMCVLRFLERVPDRDRAEQVFARLSTTLRASAALDPEAEGHVHTPLDLAPSPDALARRLFTDEVIDRHLDAVVSSQGQDGGWAPNFLMWTPVVRHEWGGFVTLSRLETLRAYGRLE